MCAILRHLGILKAVYKASGPAQVMIWLILKVDTINMTITILEEKMADTLQLVDEWSCKSYANIHDLRALLDKLFHVWYSAAWPPGFSSTICWSPSVLALSLGQ